MNVDATEAVDPRGEQSEQRTSRTQRLIAERMLEAKTAIPEFSVRDEVDVAAVLAMREQWDRSDPDRPSLNDFLLKACGLALRSHPNVNASWADQVSVRYGRVNVGFAVGLPGQLVVPTVLDADQLDLRAVSREAHRLIAAVKAKTVTPAELSGATFTVSNLGMYGIADFDAIVVPGQAAILAVAAVRQVPVVENGSVVPGVRMGIRLTSDHRLIYGAEAAAFVADLRSLLEAPAELAGA